MFTETIEVDALTRLHLTEDHQIVLESGSARAINTTRVVVHDVEKLRRELFNIALVQSEQVATAERLARSSEPIDQPARKALFAAMTEVYGAGIGSDARRAERLRIISKLVGREIYSVGHRGNMTMADAHRALDILATLRDAR